MENYLNKIKKTERLNENRTRYYYVGDDFMIKVEKTEYIDLCGTYIAIKTFYNDNNGTCLGLFNPQIKKGKIDYNFVLEWNDKNIKQLLNECIKRYYNNER